ncbi:MAG: hypothetical protein N2746_06025 [Deltaproteobacteria bacterium]|nr:hypothetical protein [Deltaproteobacteria bacterium]
MNILIKRTKSRFRFPGQYFIEETGLYYNWWRWYENDLGIYFQYDKGVQIYGRSRILSLYLYSLGNPLFYIDKLGLNETCYQETPWEWRLEESIISVKSKIKWKLDKWVRGIYMECYCYWYALTKTTYITIEQYKYERAFFVCTIKCKISREERRRRESWEIIVKERTDPILAEKITKGFIREGGMGGTKRGDTCQCEQP